MPWKLLLEKNTNSHFKEHCTKADDIWLVIIRFFSSQTNLVLLTYWVVLATVYLHFYHLNFDYSTYFQCSTEFVQYPYAFFIKTITQKCSYYVLIFVKHSFLLTVKVTFGVDNSLLLVQVVYICQITFLSANFQKEHKWL